MTDRVILVDERDTALGTEDKLKAHTEARLHRAFSVFVLNGHDELLLQRRATDKYHSGGLWSNACCSHPRPGEKVADAASRRLREEMGFDCPLVPAFAFVYRAPVGSSLWEHEFDHVFLGGYDGTPDPDPTEVSDWRWASIDTIRSEQLRQPDRFTVWFHLAFAELLERGLIAPPGRT